MKIADKIVNKIMFIAINIIIWVMCGSIFLQVVTRYIFNAPLSWTEEVARICMVWMTFMGGAYLINMPKNGHIIVDAVTENVSPKMARLLKNISFVMGVVMSLLLLVCGIWLVFTSANLRMTATKMPIALLYSSAPVSAIFMLFIQFRIFYEKVTGKIVREGESI